MNIPEITPKDLAARLQTPDDFILLDVRESWELARARLDDKRLFVVPLSRLGREGTAALPPGLLADKAGPVVVLCHHGSRSAQVTAWLMQQGWTDVRSLQGGLDAYARQVDPKVGAY